MLSRRDLLMSGALASRLRPEEAEALQRNPQSGGNADIQDDLREIRDAVRDLRRLTPLTEVAQIQDRQRLHFKLNQKFPDCIDIGIQVWERLYTWHLENKLPLRAARTPDGRMEMELFFTTLLLRSDVPDSHIGPPYDR